MANPQNYLIQVNTGVTGLSLPGVGRLKSAGDQVEMTPHAFRQISAAKLAHVTVLHDPNVQTSPGPLRLICGLEWAILLTCHATVDLVANALGDNKNVIGGTLPLSLYAADQPLGQLVVLVPALPPGTLTLLWGEMTVSNHDGTQTASFVMGESRQLYTQGYWVVEFQNSSFMFDQVGSDLSCTEDFKVKTTAGGLYSIGWGAKFCWQPA